MTRTPEQAAFRLNEILEYRPELTPLLTAITLELLRAEGKFPDWNKDAAHAMNVLTEEVGELAQEINEFHFSGGNETHRVCMGGEATQVGAMALRFLLHLPEYAPPPRKHRGWILHVNNGQERRQYSIERIL